MTDAQYEVERVRREKQEFADYFYGNTQKRLPNTTPPRSLKKSAQKMAKSSRKRNRG